MRTTRLLLAALAGAVAMFAWSSISHTAVIRGVGFTPLPRENAIVAELRKSIRDDGLYFFPGVDWSRKQTSEETAAWQARFAAGPHGLVVYHASGDVPVSPRKLLLQFVGDLLAAAIAAWIVSLIAASYWQRVLVVGLLGAFGCVGVSALYWNWYGFTSAFFAAHCLDKIVGWLVAGAALARVAPPRSAAAAGTAFASN